MNDSVHIIWEPNDENMRKCDQCKTVFQDATYVHWFRETSARVCENPNCWDVMNSAYCATLEDNDS